MSKAQEDKEIFSVKQSLSEDDLRDFCKKNGLPFHLTDLENLADLKSKYSFVFTGATKTETNHDHDHHWLLAAGNLIFDSFGKGEKAYEVPETFSFIKNHPAQLQEYNSTVCGEYCAAALFFLKNNSTIEEDEIGEDFANEFGFTNNRRKNDEAVYEWYHSKAGGEPKADSKSEANTAPTETP
jgi:proteasome lid subunit RPN8/RPN11